MLGDQLKSNIVLTGFMGVGKTAVGKQLAQLLQMEFIDTDQLIEESVMKIPDIFRLYGEDRFRREEMLAVKKAA
ncbi:MAG: shikimate kinase, partial [Syntrophomonadaceae bacterium]|nr:shikimate kinase [Syntrophomonadaceae bacterium]